MGHARGKSNNSDGHIGCGVRIGIGNWEELRADHVQMGWMGQGFGQINWNDGDVPKGSAN